MPRGQGLGNEDLMARQRRKGISRASEIMSGMGSRSKKPRVELISGTVADKSAQSSWTIACCGDHLWVVSRTPMERMELPYRFRLAVERTPWRAQEPTVVVMKDQELTQ